MISVGLFPGELELLGDAVGQLDHIGSDGSDPGFARLNPPVYLGDAEASQEWWRLMGDQLAAARSDDRATFDAVVRGAGTELSLTEAQAFLRVVNQARLVYAARAGVEVPDDFANLTDQQEVVLWFLSFVVDDLSDELMRLLP